MRCGARRGVAKLVLNLSPIPSHTVSSMRRCAQCALLSLGPKTWAGFRLPVGKSAFAVPIHGLSPKPVSRLPDHGLRRAVSSSALASPSLADFLPSREDHLQDAGTQLKRCAGKRVLFQLVAGRYIFACGDLFAPRCQAFLRFKLVPGRFLFGRIGRSEWRLVILAGLACPRRLSGRLGGLGRFGRWLVSVLRFAGQVVYRGPGLWDRA